MSGIQGYNLGSRVERIKRYAAALNCPESELMRWAWDEFEERILQSHESKYLKEQIRLKIQKEQFFRELKNMNSKSCSEIGGRVDE